MIVLDAMKRKLWIFSIVFQFLALYFFVTGFFPPRVSIKLEEQNDDFKCEKVINTNVISKFIFIVIDGWREDFLFERHSMKFLSDMLDSRKAFGVKCKVQHPTVTMPRLKGILGGIIPSYLDIVINLSSSEFTEDNWLQKAMDARKKVIFYGDDTWLKMFSPKKFERHDGTVSFFVTDYTEVDNNVTRHLETEVKERIDSWDIMILHYLGLDHIGHSLGARSPLIDVKLGEMDRIIEELYNNMVNI